MSQCKIKVKKITTFEDHSNDQDENNHEEVSKIPELLNSFDSFSFLNEYE